eukprot:Gb_27206 [translate_table: standard]
MEACQSYVEVTESLSFKLPKLISQSLGLSAKHLNNYFSDDMSFIHLNSLPCPSTGHKDVGALTVLYQDEVGGLEVKQKNGEWVGVEPMKGSFIINVMDCEGWSNDEYESVEHKAVVNEKKRRLSIPFLFNPLHNVMKKPLDEFVSEENLAKYREYNWGMFFK